MMNYVMLFVKSAATIKLDRAAKPIMAKLDPELGSKPCTPADSMKLAPGVYGVKSKIPCGRQPAPPSRGRRWLRHQPKTLGRLQCRGSHQRSCGASGARL